MMSRPTSLPEYRWLVAPAISANIRQKLPQTHPALLQTLYNRGLTDPAHIQAFLEGHYLESRNPFLLADMDKAVERISYAVEQGETIFVYGDFDADGVTATVLLTQALRGLGLARDQVQPYIPDRVDEGYGLNKEALSKLKAKGGSLVISVDCGIRSIAEVEHANQIGLDMIVTDHHSLGVELPPALAVINPKRPDSAYPERWLAGVGIAFKVAQALRMQMPARAQFTDNDLLDLVAIGTVADLAPLLGENRLLVIEGLKTLNQTPRIGIVALAKVAGTPLGQFTAESIAFALAPRINAAGRLESAYTAARLLAANNDLLANQLAADLNQLNQLRKTRTAHLSQLAETLVDPKQPVLIAGSNQFTAGVVGLVASRLQEKYYRPTIVMEQGESESRGSCRSIEEFHITEALDQIGHLFVRYGGHHRAAGFTIRNENLPAFIEAITQIAHEQLHDRELLPMIQVDAEIPLNQVDWALQEVLAQLEPTGTENPTPVFVTRGVQLLDYRTVGNDGAHLQLNLVQGMYGLRAIAFGQGAWAGQMPPRLDICYTIGVNEWNGRKNLQLNIQDIKLHQDN